jgi:hypothetical protein
VRQVAGWSVLLGLILGCGTGVSSGEGSTRSTLTAESHAGSSPPQATLTIFASGLNNPRGLKFGPDGQLYLAEAGVGGSNSLPRRRIALRLTWWAPTPEAPSVLAP